MRLNKSLDGTWKFCPAFKELEANQRFMEPDFDGDQPGPDQGSRRDVGWIEPGFDDSGWIDFPVPHTWNKAVPDLWSYEGYGWYRKRVEIPDSWSHKRVEFTCESSNYRTVLYVNGREAGVHEGGYTPFSIPVHQYLEFGEINTLAVSVDNVPKPERCPGGEFGWWNYGGMYRSTSLLVTDKAYMDGVRVVTEPGDGPASVKVYLEVRNEYQKDMGLDLAARLYTMEGDLVADSRAPLQVEGGGLEEPELEMVVDDPLLWTPDQPNLYRLLLDLDDRDSLELRIGIRSIDVEDGKLLINGEPLLVKGLNRHPEYAETGHKEREEDLIRDLEIIKDLGANALRCHYPYSPRTYELCDEMGILCLAEVPLYQWGRPEVKADDPRALGAAKDQLREMVGYLRNHPSVFMWSVSNENMTKSRRDSERYHQLTGMTVEGNLELVKLAHQLDPTRPVVEASNCWPGDPVFSDTDVSAVNLYIGSSTPHVESLHELTDKMHQRLEKLRQENPEKPILITEFGSWAIRGLRTDYFPGETYQAALISNYWERLMEEPGFTGGFIWCFQDSDVHRRFEWDYEFRIAYGLFDLQRRPKESARAVRALWKGE